MNTLNVEAHSATFGVKGTPYVIQFGDEDPGVSF